MPAKRMTTAIEGKANPYTAYFSLRDVLGRLIKPGPKTERIGYLEPDQFPDALFNLRHIRMLLIKKWHEEFGRWIVPHNRFILYEDFFTPEGAMDKLRQTPVYVNDNGHSRVMPLVPDFLMSEDHLGLGLLSRNGALQTAVELWKLLFRSMFLFRYGWKTRS